MDIEQWYEQVLEPLIEGQEPTTEDVDALGGLAILSADTDRTQDYVFESTRLPEIRGASALLDELNRGWPRDDYEVGDVRQPANTREIFVRLGLPTRRHKDDDDPDCIIYAGGGGLLALVPKVHADDLAEAIEQLYAQETDKATITCDWRPVTPEMVLQGYPDGGFGGLVRWAGTWLRRRKEDKTPGPFYEALPHTVRCHSCRTRPAHDRYSFPDWPLCAVCYGKRNYEGREAWFYRFQQFLVEHPDLLYYAEFSTKPAPPYLANWNNDTLRPVPQDLSELGQASRAKPGYVGLIHLDGDGLGETFFKSETAHAFRQFSQKIEEATQSVVLQALTTHLRPAKVQASKAREEANVKPAPGEWVWIHPFEIITIGGDDVWLIVPGDRAIPIAVAISTAFTEAGLRSPQDNRPCTLSGGVVIADDHNPVRILQEVTKELARNAKRARKEKEKEKGVEAGYAGMGYIDFHILKSADMLDRRVSTIRDLYPCTFGGLQLLARPYPADRLTALWKDLQQLRAHKGGFPNSQMHLVAEALLRGRMQSTLFYEYQRARDRDGHFEHLDAALRTAQAQGVEHPTPWVDVKRLTAYQYTHRTALWDIAELYDFLAEGGPR